MKRVILIGNYPPDGQQSMRRFAELLAAGFRESALAEVEVWTPPVLCRGVLGGRMSKWLGYVDQYVVAPLSLLLYRARRGSAYYHICDHSNAHFSAVLPPGRTSVTCHDVIAIEAAAGNQSHGVRPSRMGRWQQRYIRRHLLRIARVACVSAYTLERLRGLRDPGAGVGADRWVVIPNAFNAPFSHRPLGPALAGELGIEPGGYLFHLGSGHPRKNRSLLPWVSRELRARGRSLKVVCAGQAPSEAESAATAAAGEVGEVIWAGGVSHEAALELYSGAYAFVFPSLSEGFGWPLIEAQACGTAVVASARAPMPEVAGGGALYADPLDADAFADAVVALGDAATRREVLAKAATNVRRFDPRAIIGQYYEFITADAPARQAADA